MGAFLLAVVQPVDAPADRGRYLRSFLIVNKNGAKGFKSKDTCPHPNGFSRSTHEQQLLVGGQGPNGVVDGGL